MTISASRARKGPASLIMFVMMFLALGASQLHESSRAQAAIDPVLLQLEVTMDKANELHRILLEAGRWTAVRSVQANPRRERD